MDKLPGTPLPAEASAPPPPCCRDTAEQVLLDVRASNDAALGLYYSLGFERVGLRKRYYSDGEDAVLMTLLLRPRATE